MKYAKIIFVVMVIVFVILGVSLIAMLDNQAKKQTLGVVITCTLFGTGGIDKSNASACKYLNVYKFGYIDVIKKYNSAVDANVKLNQDYLDLLEKYNTVLNEQNE